MLELDQLFERHENEKFAFEQLTEPDKARRQLLMRRVYADDPWQFQIDCVYTQNQVAKDHPIQPYPAYLQYLKFITELWQHEKFLACPKSRRMFCSWTFLSLFLHDTIFHNGRHNGIVSKKEDDSGDLISRTEFIYHKIPKWRIPRELLPKIKNGKMSKQPPLLEFDEINSKLQGFAQGADQLRQYTLSGLLGDEVAFWENAQAFYSASKPTLDGGGRMTLISSRAPGFFKKIIFDQLDAPDLNFRESPPVPAKRPMEGLEVWRNPKNQFVICDIHYSADPRKRSEEWKMNVKNALPIREWLMEFERSWQTFEGRPVYEDYNRSIHVSTSTVRPEPGIPLLLGYDFGLTPAAILAQLVGRQLRILHEFVETNGSISKLAPVVWSHLQLNYLPWLHGDDKIYCYIDPAGFQKAQTDERTCADVLRKQGFRKILPGPVGWEARRKAVEDYLTKTYGDGPGLTINADTCPVLIEGFGGGYRYPEKALEIEPQMIRPLKNSHSHPHDALQYLAAGATQLLKIYNIKMPIPHYGFAQGDHRGTR